MTKTTSYAFTSAITPDGWGIIGVFPRDVVDQAAKDRESGEPIIEEKHLVVGQGGGWDSGATLDEEWLEQAVEAVNKVGRLPNLYRELQDAADRLEELAGDNIIPESVQGSLRRRAARYRRTLAEARGEE